MRTKRGKANKASKAAAVDPVDQLDPVDPATTTDAVSPPVLPSPPPPVGHYELVATDRLVISTANPRKHFDERQMTELESSIRAHGIMVPLIARPTDGGRLELVAGERRLRTALKVGMAEVPVVVRDFTDEQAFDAQLLENGQRSDIHPLEEADAFRHKRDHFHRTIEEIAASTGKTSTYVSMRLKLTELCDEAREAFFEGKIRSAAIGLLLARIPDLGLQRKALEEITASNYNDSEGMSYRQARAHIERGYMLDLERASFPITDPDLVPSAGACTTCPKRTGNQGVLFEDVDKADVCTDPPCFWSKVNAGWQRQAEESRAATIKVLSEKESKAIWPSHYSQGDFQKAGLVDLNRPCYEDSKERTYKQLLRGIKPVAIARNPHDNRVYEFVESKGLTQALKAAGHDFKKRSSSGGGGGGGDSYRKQQLAQQRAKEVKQRAAAAAMALLVAAVEKGKPDKQFVLTILGKDLQFVHMHEKVFKRRGVVSLKAAPAYVAKLSEAQLRGLLVEFTFSDGDRLVGYDGNISKPFTAACAAYKVPLKKLEEQERAAAEAKRKEADKKKAPKKAAKKGAGLAVERFVAKGRAGGKKRATAPAADEVEQGGDFDEGEE